MRTRSQNQGCRFAIETCRFTPLFFTFAFLGFQLGFLFWLTGSRSTEERVETGPRKLRTGFRDAVSTTPPFLASVLVYIVYIGWKPETDATFWGNFGTPEQAVF
jgi:hypothetical protein